MNNVLGSLIFGSLLCAIGLTGCVAQTALAPGDPSVSTTPDTTTPRPPVAPQSVAPPASAADSNSGSAGNPSSSAARAPSADPTSFASSIVKVDVQAIDGATTSASLGAQRSGSGVIVGPGVVLTIGYLVLEADQLAVTTNDGKRVPATVAGYDSATGFGLLRTLVPIQGAALELGDSDSVAARSRVFTQGQGEGEATELLVTSRKPFAGSWEYLVEKPIYTFPPVNNWSGSALVSSDGKLIGIGSLIVNDAADAQSGIPGNMFVPVNLLKPIYSELLTHGRRSTPAQPWLGMSTEDLRGHLVVTRVASNGPAASAGIVPGDIVIGVGADKVRNQADFYRRLFAAGPAGSAIPLQMLKDGEVRRVPVKSVDRSQTFRQPGGI